MGHGYKDGLILWLAAWYIRLYLAVDSIVRYKIETHIEQGSACMPYAHINTAKIIAGAVGNLHPAAQYTMSSVLLGLPTKGE